MKKFSKELLKQRLTKEQFHVTQENGTEPPFKSIKSFIIDIYYDCKKPGIYNCIVCNIPLFSSELKFDSGCGWPAFYDELKGANIKKIKDYTYGMVRTEVRCSNCDSHLGHVFDDGPIDKTGIRYCINSASINLEETK